MTAFAKLFRTTSLLAIASLSTQPALAQAVIDNGTIAIGGNPDGSLVTPGGVGLVFLPNRTSTNAADGLASGCACEGWGVADLSTGAWGQAGQTFGQDNITVLSTGTTGTGTFAGSDGSSGYSYVQVSDGAFDLRVDHDMHPSVSRYLYEADVTLSNTASTEIGDLVYRRVMDWDIPPTAFSEYVTIQGWPASALIGSSDNGFVEGNPNTPLTTLAPDAVLNGNFTDSGPYDHGAAFDFSFGTVASGDSVGFDIYYGAAPSEADALLALSDVGAEVYSLGQADVTDGASLGVPNTFMFGFSGVGGTPLPPTEASAPANQYSDSATVAREQSSQVTNTVMSEQAIEELAEEAGIDTSGGQSAISLRLMPYVGFGDYSDHESDTGFRYRATGLSVVDDRSFDVAIGPFDSLMVGGAFSFGLVDADLSNNGGTLRTKSYALQGFTRLSTPDDFFAEASLTGTLLKYEQDRVGVSQTFHSETDGRTLNLMLRGGKYMPVFASSETIARIGAYGSLSANYLDVDSFEEQSAGLTYGKLNGMQYEAGGGLRAEALRMISSTTVFARADLGVFVPFANTIDNVSQSTVGGAQLQRSISHYEEPRLQLTTSVGVLLSSRWRGSIDYVSGFVRGTSTDHQINLRVSYQF